MSEPERYEPERSPTPIEPVRKGRRLALSAEDAFGLFTERMGTWWPLQSHSIGGAEAADVRFEGHVGGHVVELTRTGHEYSWADVLVWEPPGRVVLAWHPTVEIVAASTVEVRFESVEGGTVLHLEHRDWEAFGESLGNELRAGYEPGWDAVLAPFEAHAAS